MALDNNYDPDRDELVKPVGEIAPGNKPGPFYTTTECIICDGPPQYAPEHMSLNWVCGEATACRFFEQPRSQDELDRVFEAFEASCVAALRYRGTNKEILRQMIENGLEEFADALVKRDEKS
jgi:hypothetical protein